MIDRRPTPAEIRAFRTENPKMRERDAAERLGISEAALVAAECGLSVVRIDGDANRFLARVGELGEVMALTRNESAVHEKIGPFEKVQAGKQATLVLGTEIDLRVFPSAWAHGFAVTKTDGDTVRRSFQFFDRAGIAVHKVHLRPASNLEAYQAILDDLRLEDQAQTFTEEAIPADKPTGDVDALELRARWSRMTDTHQFHGMLRSLNVSRRDALHNAGADYAEALEPSAVEAMFRGAAGTDLPLMCFVGNRGVIQIHSGPVANVQTMGPWLNVMDPTFHLHLRTDHIAEAWLVRKPTSDGHVTSVEVLDARGELIIQFFGKRKEGKMERDDWRDLAEGLPRLARTVAA
ncbi:putative hemin transport protein [Rhizobium sp. RU20A]|uniref:hemin-degrading factor n=1 Tax=Rhizobium sp. RU20A TaxID=1907412 RepID=UPI000955461D|nr:ChuX/HutX family heme-like substrate-binding protein [Rhizobium sp. RU20A]SIQ30888.1 putative hemin transport protein [Rhizobium sp. RU20A]